MLKILQALKQQSRRLYRSAESRILKVPNSRRQLPSSIAVEFPKIVCQLEEVSYVPEQREEDVLAMSLS